MTEPVPSNAQPSRLPIRITPCPIVLATIDVRFQSDLPASFVPGYVYAQVKERFPKQSALPQAQIPDAIRVSQPELKYQPTVVMGGEKLMLHVGPNILSLGMSQTDYAGWPVYQESFAWVLEKIHEIGLVKIPETLGLRYADFFPAKLSECLQVDLFVGNKSVLEHPLQINAYLERDGFTCGVLVNNSSFLNIPGRPPKPGCLLDINMRFDIPSDKFWSQAPDYFDRAHDTQKKIFFNEILSPAWLAKSNPVYSL